MHCQPAHLPRTDNIFHLTLIHSGNANNSERAKQNIERFCARELANCCQIDFVDILADPSQANRLGILVTPTLIKTTPTPEQRMIGDLSDDNRIKALLGLSENNAFRQPEPC